MSTATNQSRFHPRRRIGSACSAVSLAVLVGLLTIALGASPASAYWSSTGTGTAAGQTGALAPPTDVTVPDEAFTDVPVSWTAGTGGVEPEGYYVTRQADTETFPACDSSPAELLTTTSCLDLDVADGGYLYVVTAVFRSWTAPSAETQSVIVINPTQLGFVVEPTDVTAGEAIAPAVVVTLLSAAGNPVAYAGIPITLAIGTNPSTGSLAGTTTVNTAADGTATFPNLSIDRAGVGYTLVATSPDLNSATSNLFNVLPPPPLGDASSYSVLGGAGVVNTLGSNVSGDLGVGPGMDATGFGPGGGTVGGDIHRGDQHAQDALADAASAYTAFMDLEAPPENELSGNLNGLTLGPGVYHSTAALGITGTVTFNGGANDVFIIQVDAALNTAAGDHVVLTGGAQASNVYWVVDGAVTLGAGTLFKGTILADGAITIGDSTELIGRAFATGAVTMANNTIRFTPALPPTLTMTGGAAVVTKDTTPAISGTTNAPVGTTIKVTVDGQVLTTTVQTGGGWSVTAASLLAGAYDVVAQVRDAAGNATKAFQTLTVEVNPDPVDLGSAASFSVLSGGNVTNGGPTQLSGDLGYEGSLLGDTAPTVGGATYINDTITAAAQDDLLEAIDDATDRRAHTQFPGTLGGRTFHVGVHESATAAGLTGTVTLDGEGDPNAVFIFQINGAFTAAASCQVNLINEAQADNVFWVVAGAASIGASCSLAGNIMTTDAITLGASTNLEGRALSQAAVTLASNTITGATPRPAARMGSARSRTSSESSAPTASSAPSPSNESSPASEPTASVEPSPSEEPSPSSEPTPSAEPSPSTQPSPSSSATAASQPPTPTPTPTPSGVSSDGAR